MAQLTKESQLSHLLIYGIGMDNICQPPCIVQ